MPSATQTTSLTLIRHGESNVTVNRVIGGHRSCSGLSELGRRQAERLRDRLRDTAELAPDVLIASHFARAIETGEAIAPAFGGISIEIDPGFGEHDPGPEIDGMSFDAYIERFGRPDWNDPNADVFPGGETIAAFHARVAAALASVFEQQQGKSVVVACHGGVIDAAFRLLLQTSATGSFELHTLNTSITEFAATVPTDTTSSLSWRLRRYNDVAHLHGLPAETPRVASSDGEAERSADE